MGRSVAVKQFDYTDLRKKFSDALANAMALLIAGEIDTGEFNKRASAAVQDAYPEAYLAGMESQGGDARDFTDADRATVQDKIGGHQGEERYLRNFSSDVVGSGVSQDEVDRRIDLYANSLDEIYALGALAMLTNEMLTFGGESGKESCNTCQSLMGQRHRASWWQDRGLIPGQPGNRNFECQGFQCQHLLFNDSAVAVTIT